MGEPIKIKQKIYIYIFKTLEDMEGSEIDYSKLVYRYFGYSILISLDFDRYLFFI